MLLMADMAVAKSGLAKIWRFLSQEAGGWGASAGRSWTPTETVSVMMEAMMKKMPTHPIHEILPRVRIEPRRKPAMAATATKTAVHAPWLETALRAVDTPTMAEPRMKIMTAAVSVVIPGMQAWHMAEPRSPAPGDPGVRLVAGPDAEGGGRQVPRRVWRVGVQGPAARPTREAHAQPTQISGRPCGSSHAKPPPPSAFGRLRHRGRPYSQTRKMSSRKMRMTMPPMGPARFVPITAPASAIECTCGYVILNWPMTTPQSEKLVSHRGARPQSCSTHRQ